MKNIKTFSLLLIALLAASCAPSLLPETFSSADETFEFHIVDWEDDDDETVNF